MLLLWMLMGALLLQVDAPQAVPGNSNGPAAELDLHTVLVTSVIGRDPGLKAPPFEPETTVPHAVKDPLRFLGKAPGVTPPAAEEPDETEEEEPAPPK
jgi:hypothetical protein